MSNEDRRSKDERGTMIERNHPQTRKGERDARDSAIWQDDVDRPDEERDRDEDIETVTVAELAKEAEAVREQAIGGKTAGNALGSSAGRDVGSGTTDDRGESRE